MSVSVGYSLEFCILFISLIINFVALFAHNVYQSFNMLIYLSVSLSAVAKHCPTPVVSVVSLLVALGSFPLSAGVFVGTVQLPAH